MNSNIISKASFLSLFLFIILLPVFFLPFTNIPVESGKGLFLVVGLIASIIFWIILRFSDGKIELPKSLPLAAGGVIVIVFLLSSLFGGASSVSLFGTMFDTGTFWFIFAGFILMVLSSIVFKETKKARIVLFGTMLSGAVVILFQIAHLFLPKILSLGVLVNKTDNLIGSWNSLGIFAGFFIISALFAIEFFAIEKRLKIILGVFTVLALALIATVNFFFIWEILGVFALLIFIYKISINAIKNKEDIKTEFPVFSFVVFLISLFFFMSSGLIGGILPTRLGITNNEVSPSFLSTMSVTKSVIKENPILGMGPNRFAEAWALYKPAVINSTQFWDVSFSSGSGLLPTLISTSGILGILSWVLFFALFIFTGVKWLFFSIKNNVSLETVSFFFLSLYLFVSSFFYLTGSVLFLLAFVFAGVFIGLVGKSRKDGEISFSFFDDHRKSFFFMLVLVVIMILIAATGFKYVQKFISVPYFTRTLAATSITDAETNISRALILNSNDLYLRTYSQVYLLKMDSIVSSGATSLSDEDKAKLQNSLDQAVNGSQLAINYNSKNYLNYQMLGSVYQTAGLIGVKDAYPKALEAFMKASELNPGNPRLKLVMSNISSSLESRKDAKDYALAALAMKPDYIDALIVLAQLSKNEGNTNEAISYAEKALALSPGNKDLIKYVESLRNGTPLPVVPETPTTEAQ